VIVVADTSVLINLCRVGQGGLLLQLFQEVIIPMEVAVEFNRLAEGAGRFAGLKLPLGIKQRQAAAMIPAVRSVAGLDLGEAAALSLAIEIHADAVLIDERRGYEIAIQLGLRTVGILGILLRAKSAALIPAVRPVLVALRQDAGFWLSDTLQKQVLAVANENS
jgi:hypothetical protein